MLRSNRWLVVLGLQLVVSLGYANDRPNVVLFLVDDMGWMDSSVYGSKYYETPNMERLAHQSMRFTDAYAVPLCSPTRASILSGQYTSRHGVTSASGHRPPADAGVSPYPKNESPRKQWIYAESKNYLEPELIVLPEVLREAGYRTGHFGKWHLGLMPQHWPDQHGFETIWHCAPDPGPPSYFSPYEVSPDGRPGGRQRVGNITDGPKGEYITDRLTDEAIRFIDTHRDEPFYLNLWQYGVHGPWGHKEEYTRYFKSKADPRGEQRNPIMASMLKSVDESLGRILDRLDELKLTEKTLFIFYSDNGGNTHSNTPDDIQPANLKPDNPKYDLIRDWQKWAGAEPPTNNAPLREGKGRIYEGGQRVPLMVRWPGKIQPDSVSHEVVGPIDLYPTILDALGISLPPNHIVDGESILPVLEAKGSIERDAYFTWFPHLIPAVSVRMGEWKLIRRFESHPKYPEVRELYNLKDDLGESNNLASKLPDKVRELDTLIDQFIEQTGANAPKLNPAYQPTVQNARATENSVVGLVPRLCKLTLKEGLLLVEGDGKTPFLGTAQVKSSQPLRLKLRVRSEAGGVGRVQWKSTAQEQFPESGQKVAFEIPAGEAWHDLEVMLPIEIPASLIRLYLPADRSPVEIQSIEYRNAKTEQPIRRWIFSGTKGSDE